ncbi:MAG TPA: glycosyltransferase family 2 protein [Rariglobus sp.]
MTSLLSRLPEPPAGRTGWPWTEETPPSVYAESVEWPRISIVTPSYNQAAYLEETIRSILLQNYPDLQYLVIDGGSDDGSLEIIKKYAPWISRWESERDRGQSHAINKGLSRCDGRWFNWINSDDCLLPGALAAVGRTGAGTAIIAAVQTTGLTLNEARPLGRTRIAATLEDTLVNHFICQQGLFLRTDVVKSLQGVREELHYVMDLDLFARALLQNGLESVRQLPDVVAFFRRHDQAKTTTSAEHFFREERRLFHGLGEAARLSPELLRHVAGPAAPLPVAVSVSRIDRPRLSRALALKFWWDGAVEENWRTHDFTAFKRELRAFRNAFPDVSSARISRLGLMARLPDALLRVLSRFRA